MFSVLYVRLFISLVMSLGCIVEALPMEMVEPTINIQPEDNNGSEDTDESSAVTLNLGDVLVTANEVGTEDDFTDFVFENKKEEATPDIVIVEEPIIFEEPIIVEEPILTIVGEKKEDKANLNASSIDTLDEEETPLGIMLRTEPIDGEETKPEEKEVKARSLSDPDPAKCSNRPSQFSFGDHGYFYSEDEDQLAGVKVDWLEARNICRKFCMDLVSIETPKENQMITEFLISRDLPYIWTSGRLCNFKGCDKRPDLQPPSVAGWFWSGSGVRMAPTNSTPPFWPSQPWSYTGHRSKFEGTDVPQPDNAEFLINGNTEACMAIFNDVYDDGVSWHDVACYHKKFFICEDSDKLIKQVATESSV